MYFYEFFSNDNDTDIPNATKYGFSKSWKNGVVFRYAQATDLKPVDQFEV